LKNITNAVEILILAAADPIATATVNQGPASPAWQIFLRLIQEVRFAQDSPQEEDGFELSVPPREELGRAAISRDLNVTPQATKPRRQERALVGASAASG
jgi:hypothetical protein